MPCVCLMLQCTATVYYNSSIPSTTHVIEIIAMFIVNVILTFCLVLLLFKLSLIPTNVHCVLGNLSISAAYSDNSIVCVCVCVCVNVSL